MSLRIGNTPSFNGIVKVKLVFDGDKQTNDKAVVDSATKQLKAVLMKKDKDSKIVQNILKKNHFDRQTTLNELNEELNKNLKIRLTNKSIFRQIYTHFDKDYKIPVTAPTDDARDVFTKVRTGKYGNDVYLVSGADAADVSVTGRNIGGKKSLERIDSRHTGVAQQAKENYFSIKDEIAARYSKDPLQPGIYLYTQRDEKGIVRLVGARMENSQNLVNIKNPMTKTIIMNPQYINKGQDCKSTQNNTQQNSSIKSETTEPTQTVSKSDSETKQKLVQMEGLADGIPCEDKGKNPILEELSTKKWDLSLLKPKKKNHKKIKDDPRQTFFNF